GGRRHTRSKRDWSSDVCSSDLFIEQNTQVAAPRGLLMTRADRPPDRAGRQQSSRCGDLRVLLDERHDRAGRLAADPAVLAPPQTDRKRVLQGKDADGGSSGTVE